MFLNPNIQLNIVFIIEKSYICLSDVDPFDLPYLIMMKYILNDRDIGITQQTDMHDVKHEWCRCYTHAKLRAISVEIITMFTRT